MSNYAKVESGVVIQFPSYPQVDNPNISFAEGWQGEIDGIEYVIVEYVPYENTDPNKQVVYDELPQAVDGVWKLNYSLVNISLEQAKSNKLQNIEQEWGSLEILGWDSGQGYHLGITPSDVALLVGVFSLAKEAAALGLELPHLISMANTPISFSTIQEMTLLLLQYGQARSNMASSFAARRKAVADATTIEELGVI